MEQYLAPYKTNSITEGFQNNLNNSPEFLRSLVANQKSNLDSLIIAAKRLGPVAMKIEQQESAYDAGFETNTKQTTSPVSTLQGVALVLLITSYFAFMIISTITVNRITESVNKTIGTFVAFILLGVIILSIIIRTG
jgi:hypothetical protein